MVAHTGNPNAGEVETGRPIRFSGEVVLLNQWSASEESESNSQSKVNRNRGSHLAQPISSAHMCTHMFAHLHVHEHLHSHTPDTCGERQRATERQRQMSSESHKAFIRENSELSVDLIGYTHPGVTVMEESKLAARMSPSLCSWHVQDQGRISFQTSPLYLQRDKNVLEWGKREHVYLLKIKEVVASHK